MIGPDGGPCQRNGDAEGRHDEQQVPQEEEPVSEFDTPGVKAGTVVWANWRKGTAAREPADPWAIREIGSEPEPESELPPDIKAMLKERYDNIDVALPRKDR